MEGVVTEVRDLHAAGQLKLGLALREFQMRYAMPVPVEPRPRPHDLVLTPGLGGAGALGFSGGARRMARAALSGNSRLKV